VALIFLLYTPINELTSVEKYALATDLALAALTGDEVYSFGEVIACPVFNQLKNSANEYLHELVLALNEGNIDIFNAIIDSNREAYFAQDVLRVSHEKIQQKAVLLSLMNMIFELPSHERNISYSSIANASRVLLDQVIYMKICASICTFLLIYFIYFNQPT
jgi:26S proteasome regulatory subunit N9